MSTTPTCPQSYALSVAEAARHIVATAHAQVLQSIAGEHVFVMKFNSKSELNITLTCPAPTLFRAGRFTFTAEDVKEIRGTPTQWLIVLH
jgi:hypothetical protein